MDYQPLRSFNHGEGGALTNLPLDPPVVSERGLLLAEIEFLTRHARVPCVCVVTHASPRLVRLAKLFNHVHFYAYNTDSAEYDPESAVISPLQGHANITPHPRGDEKAAFIRWGMRDPDQCPVLLMAGEDSHERLMLLHTIIRPNQSLLKINTLPMDFLSGTMYYPVHAAGRASVCFLDVPRHAHCRVCYPDVWTEEIAYFHGVLRSPGAYDLQAETFILRDYARTILCDPPANAWASAERIRMELPSD